MLFSLYMLPLGNIIRKHNISFYLSIYLVSISRYLFETVAKLMKKKASSPEVSKQHSSNDFMNFFTYKIDNIRDKIITMQPSTTVSL